MTASDDLSDVGHMADARSAELEQRAARPPFVISARALYLTEWLSIRKSWIARSRPWRTPTVARSSTG
jgi:hypothetical protein